MSEAEMISCKKCKTTYLETWDNQKCPHKQIANVIKEGKKNKDGTYEERSTMSERFVLPFKRKFVSENKISGGRFSSKKRSFARPRLVKCCGTKTIGGYICVPGTIYLPKELIGRRVKIRIEILGEGE